MTPSDSALERFREAAVDWAAGGRGSPLVKAAAAVLAEDADSPSLRLLAGAPSALADAEALDYGPDAFAELALSIEPRLSSAASIAGARAIARRFLDDDPGNPRELTRRLYRLYVQADYPDELAAWSGFDDYYACILNGSMEGSIDDLDADVRQAAKALVAHTR